MVLVVLARSVFLLRLTLRHCAVQRPLELVGWIALCLGAPACGTCFATIMTWPWS